MTKINLTIEGQPTCVACGNALFGLKPMSDADKGPLFNGIMCADCAAKKTTAEREPLKGSTEEPLTALAIVKELADWSKRYPRERIYHMNSREQQDGELIAIEEKAKAYMSAHPSPPAK